MEVASGRGFWASLLRLKGVEIFATDINKPRTNDGWYNLEETFTYVEDLNNIEAIKTHKTNVLMISWPHWNDDVACTSLMNLKGIN